MGKTTIAKISRPNAAGIIPRKRLFRLLNNGKKPVTWVAGPAGSGKTSLIASYLDSRKIPCLWYQVDEGDADTASFFYYLGLAAKKAAPRYRKPLPLLTPEYLQGLPTFSRRFFENLYARLKPPFAIVFDNYQDAPEQSPVQELINTGLSLIPAGIRVFVVSRKDPPPQFMRLRANNAVQVVRWDELRFTLDETKQFVRQKKKRAEVDVGELHAKTEGWAAGLVLINRTIEMKSPGDGLPSKLTHSELFDYFAGEIFYKADAGTRNFLLCTSFMPILTIQMAERLTGFGQAGRLFADLRRNHFFITSNAESVCQYHPLFREFLMDRAREIFPQEELEAILKSAASILKDNGRPEDAALLFHEAKDWQSFIDLILEQGPVLVANGRLQTLAEWLAVVPESLFAESAWLWYWLGSCRAPCNSKAGLEHFWKAFDLFQRDKDMTGALLAWAGAVNTVLLGWNDFAPLDSLIAWLDERTNGIAFPSTEVEAECAASMAGAMAWRQPDHPDIRGWVERALNATRRSENSALKLQAFIHASYYYLWLGDIPNALFVGKEIKEITHRPAVSPLTLITCRWLEAVTSYLADASYETGLQAVSEALETAYASGVHVWDHIIYAQGIYGALLKGDREKASEFLEGMKSTLRADQSHGYCHYHFLVAWYNILFGDLPGALLHAELSLKLAVEIRGSGLYFPEILCRLALADILCEKKNYHAAAGHLSVAGGLVKRTRSAIMAFMYRLAGARVALEQGHGAEGINMLRGALELGRSHNFINTLYWWRPSVMAALCQKALEEGIDVEYVQYLIRKRNLSSECQPSDIDNWPWPLKVNTLGRFEIIHEGKPLCFTGKAQKRPLQMLKAMIASGPEGIQKDRLIDALWPESEGDAGNIAFHTTLSRLRRLVGDEKCIQFNEGILSLDRRSCRVDAWVFEELLERIEAARNSEGDISALKILSDKAVGLYKGIFLPADPDFLPSVPVRERLRSKFLRFISRTGQALEHSGDFEAALDYYARGLESESLAEELHQGLISCYLSLGRKADAVTAYRRCKAILFAELGVEPSPQTELLKQQLSEI